MVTIIEGKNANELFVKLAREMLKNGKTRTARGFKTLELDDVWLVLENPSESVVSLPERNLNLIYLDGENKWYDSGSLLAKDAARHSKFWLRLADSNGTVNSNYGFLTMIEKHAGMSQFEWCVARLKKDKYTRQAIMNYNQPRHKYPKVKDFVCTISQQFIVRDEKLCSVSLMRSNDVIYGLSYDLPWFSRILFKVAKKSKLHVGNLNHYAASMHVYERHFEMLEKIAGADIGQT